MVDVFFLKTQVSRRSLQRDLKAMEDMGILCGVQSNRSLHVEAL